MDNSRFKFRAWYKEANKMIFPSWFQLNCGENGSVNSNYVPMLKLNEIILMQYTGLKDKDGLDIYEGDVVQDDDGEKELVNSPEWFHCDAFDCYGYAFASGYFTDNYNKADGSRFLSECTVIGNIYENKELLNG